jgi:hypothetical protein
MNTIMKIGAVLALATILATVASAYGNYRTYKTDPLPTSPEATISRTPGGPGQRFN